MFTMGIFFFYCFSSQAVLDDVQSSVANPQSVPVHRTNRINNQRISGFSGFSGVLEEKMVGLIACKPQALK